MRDVSAAGFRELATRPVGVFLLLASLAGFGFVLGQLRHARHRKAGSGPWWFGYARDLTNLCALGATSVALALGGFAGPLALLGGFLITLVTYFADYWLAHGLHLRAASWLAA